MEINIDIFSDFCVHKLSQNMQSLTECCFQACMALDLRLNEFTVWYKIMSIDLQKGHE